MIEKITIERAAASCPKCGFHTKHNGILEHAAKLENGLPCPLRGSQKLEEGEITVPREPTDLMRQAAWAVWPDCDAPITELYKAMLSAWEQERQ